MLPLITITTDFGTKDGFVAQMKGVISGINGQVRIVDVTHDIKPFSITEGALVLKGISGYFPDGTIHVAVVDPGVGGDRRGVVLHSHGSYYVGPDNGLFSFLLSDDTPWQMRAIENPSLMLKEPHPTFHGRDVFASTAAHLSKGLFLQDVGRRVVDPVTIDIPRIEEIPDGIEGRIIHIDRFGNLTTNVDAGTLDRPIESAKAGDVTIRELSRFFGQVRAGEPLALINSFGFLEIAVNQGDASKELQLGIGDPVTITWQSGSEM
jgi:S-adenosyl-L-methionine hydrolase (adenosine-forming)